MNEIIKNAMSVALEEATFALQHDDVPVGAVVLLNEEIIARRHNEREVSQDPTAHAEILALQDAAKVVGSWRLIDATLVVTLEPCIMCAGAALAARVKTVVFGAMDPKAGATGSLFDVSCDPRLNHKFEVISGIMAEQSSQQLKDFFAARRKSTTSKDQQASEL